MNAQSKLNQIETTLKAIEEARVNAIKENAANFKEAAMAPFEACPQLLAYRWTQYTPHFNDGDPCTFRAYVHSYKVEGFKGWDEPSRYDDDEEESDWSSYTLAKESPSFADARELADRIVNQYGMLQSLFGDGYMVTVHKDGTIDVEEYEHD
jgi:hypothetical protein